MFLKDVIYLFLEREEREEKESETNVNVWLPLAHLLLGTWPTTQACALTGSRTGNPLVHRLALSPLSHTSQGYFLKHFNTFQYHVNFLHEHVLSVIRKYQ